MAARPCGRRVRRHRLAPVAVWLAALAGAARAGELDGEVEKLVAKHRMDAVGAAGVYALRVGTGEELAARRGEEAFPLASVTKVFTAAAALEVLGADAGLATRAWAVACTCGGDGAGHARLVVVGEGEPGISGRDHGGNPAAVFERWAAQLKAAGHARLCRIVLDETRFHDSHVAPGWPQDQLTQWYCAPWGALSLNDNCVDITVAASAPGEPAKVTLSPDTRFVTLDVRCTTTAEKAQHVVSFTRKPGTNRITVSGKFWAKSSPWTESVTIHDPGLYFGTVLRETLARAGLAAADVPIERAAGAFQPAETAAPPLVSRTELVPALRVMLQRSQNFYAEQLFHAQAPRGADAEACAAAGRRALAPLGVRDDAVAWLDGSGLSRGNRASPATVARLLAAAAARPWGEQYRTALAAPGEPGTLQKRLAGLEKSVRAKTGTIASVSNLAGFVETPKGRVAFAILCSQLKEGSAPAQQLQDDVVRLLAR